eukprot:TRINITY_DN59748_c0_g1_i1.p1 TRINITY_DN59748_c0_g1~~TRINITY_DN59748_c0_g1_i1.p1  ORF type:complete len:593 (-),score=84.82 TRINITY_DN59748_c0_g1_i1:1098-2855(-)
MTTSPEDVLALCEAGTAACPSQDVLIKTLRQVIEQKSALQQEVRKCEKDVMQAVEYGAQLVQQVVQNLSEEANQVEDTKAENQQLTNDVRGLRRLVKNTEREREQLNESIEVLNKELEEKSELVHMYKARYEEYLDRARTYQAAMDEKNIDLQRANEELQVMVVQHKAELKQLRIQFLEEVNTLGNTTFESGSPTTGTHTSAFSPDPSHDSAEMDNQPNSENNSIEEVKLDLSPKVHSTSTGVSTETEHATSNSVTHSHTVSVVHQATSPPTSPFTRCHQTTLTTTVTAETLSQFHPELIKVKAHARQLEQQVQSLTSEMKDWQTQFVLQFKFTASLLTQLRQVFNQNEFALQTLYKKLAESKASYATVEYEKARLYQQLENASARWKMIEEQEKEQGKDKPKPSGAKYGWLGVRFIASELSKLRGRYRKEDSASPPNGSPDGSPAISPRSRSGSDGNEAAAAQSEVSELTRTAKEAEEKIKLMQSDTENLVNRLSKLQLQNWEFEEEIAELQLRLETSSSEAASLREYIHHKETEVPVLDTSTNTLTLPTSAAVSDSKSVDVVAGGEDANAENATSFRKFRLFP